MDNSGKLNVATGEQLIVVNERDRIIGAASRSRCLRLGLRHRAIMILIFNAKRQLYLQLRNRQKLWYPNTWTASVSGHVQWEETYWQAAARELGEELSMRCPLHRLDKLRTPSWRFGEIVEREFIAIYRGHWNGKITPATHEIADGEFVSLDQLSREISNRKRRCTPDLVLVLHRLPRKGDSVSLPAT